MRILTPYDYHSDYGMKPIMEMIERFINEHVISSATKIIAIDEDTLFSRITKEDNPEIPTIFDNNAIYPTVYTIEKDTGKVSWHHPHELEATYPKLNYRILTVQDVLQYYDVLVE